MGAVRGRGHRVEPGLASHPRAEGDGDGADERGSAIGPGVVVGPGMGRGSPQRRDRVGSLEGVTHPGQPLERLDPRPTEAPRPVVGLGVVGVAEGRTCDLEPRQHRHVRHVAPGDRQLSPQAVDPAETGLRDDDTFHSDLRHGIGMGRSGKMINVD